ncbi:MAG: hypothetical protein J07HX64_02841 [halophilic archaeon J07HX64]|nr:MAG: hypothetical protein J07HX64_02841 [halophilic archaeon J07HX64]
MCSIASTRERSFRAKRGKLLELGTLYLDVPYGFVSDIEDGEQLITSSVGNHDLLQPASRARSGSRTAGRRSPPTTASSPSKTPVEAAGQRTQPTRCSNWRRTSAAG